jgi:hypothetical protein
MEMPGWPRGIEGRLAAAMVIVPFGSVLPKKFEGGADRSSISSRSITGRLSSDSYSSPFVLNRRINVESVMFRFLFLIESVRFCAGLFV